MDSITQVLLGAAVGEATGGKQFGRKAALWGAVCGTLPDLDVFIPLGDAVSDFTYHRSASHSIVLMLVVAPIISWLITRIHVTTREHYCRWTILVFLSLATHALLDSFTVYGTQIFWPISEYPMTWSTIFIIDPLYTIPLLIGVIWALISRHPKTSGYHANRVGLIVSTVYLGWTIAVKLYINTVTENSIIENKLNVDQYLTTPSAFNSLLWRIVLVDDTSYYEGYYSIFDSTPNIQFEKYSRSTEQIRALSEHWPVKRLQWFTKNFYKVQSKESRLIITDLRMGSEPQYVFNFVVAEEHNPHYRPVKAELVNTDMDFRRAELLWQRIWDDSIKISPAASH
ncbi:metal-dependent hydrolase [Pleionea sediminis]|uniref:metal-dependent hydrolase n=1 Tax=Pleionea sediminis TaxID=2569479 RepID=UPI0011863D9B|nr:metal-dependent hydrolase [Pleionea sediminis]